MVALMPPHGRSFHAALSVIAGSVESTAYSSMPPSSLSTSIGGSRSLAAQRSRATLDAAAASDAERRVARHNSALRSSASQHDLAQAASSCAAQAGQAPVAAQRWRQRQRATQRARHAARQKTLAQPDSQDLLGSWGPPDDPQPQSDADCIQEQACSEEPSEQLRTPRLVGFNWHEPQPDAQRREDSAHEAVSVPVRAAEAAKPVSALSRCFVESLHSRARLPDGAAPQLASSASAAHLPEMPAADDFRAQPQTAAEALSPFEAVEWLCPGPPGTFEGQGELTRRQASAGAGGDSSAQWQAAIAGRVAAPTRRSLDAPLPASASSHQTAVDMPSNDDSLLSSGQRGSGEMWQGGATQLFCVVCLEDYQAGQAIKVLPCGHRCASRMPCSKRSSALHHIVLNENRGVAVSYKRYQSMLPCRSRHKHERRSSGYRNACYFAGSTASASAIGCARIACVQSASATPPHDSARVQPLMTLAARSC